ncbi:MAG: hypothetical protein FWE32_08195 [Oscillospiraceae bacterium]|nr:hypothetical protein [Oscillospiraceae bacterium]
MTKRERRYALTAFAGMILVIALITGFLAFYAGADCCLVVADCERCLSLLLAATICKQFALALLAAVTLSLAMAGLIFAMRKAASVNIYTPISLKVQMNN